MRRSAKRSAALAALVLVVGAAVAAVAYGLGTRHGHTTRVVTTVAAVPAKSSTQSSTTANTTGPLSIGEIAKDSSPGVVEIVTSSSSSQSPFGGGSGSGTSQAEGTGFVLDTAGHVVTNEHVVQGASSFTVTFDDQATYRATLVGSDASTDIAVLKVNAPASLLHPLSFADSSDVAVGDPVVAIGDPFELADTVTSGIVSAVGREITSPNSLPIENAIQTDAAINHGNSGGPLFNVDGKVIGVNAQIQSSGGGNEGIGFAIPSNTVKRIVDQLLQNGSVEHSVLGIDVRTVPASLAGTLGDAAGVAVQTVLSGTGAKKAGLQASTGSTTIAGVSYPTGGDVITAVDGTAVVTAQQLRGIIDTHQPGDKITLQVAKSGKTRTVTATLGKRTGQ